MPKEYAFPPKFKVIVNHLKAVRTLDEYVNGAVLKKDMQDLFNHVMRELTNKVLRPAGWSDMHCDKGNLYSTPKQVNVVDPDAIAITVEVLSPLDAELSSVELYAPKNWRRRGDFIDKIKRIKPPDFEHFDDYPAGDIEETSAIWKYVPYDSFIGSDGLFDGAHFIDAFCDATTTLVRLEKKIDAVLADLADIFD